MSPLTNNNASEKKEISEVSACHSYHDDSMTQLQGGHVVDMRIKMEEVLEEHSATLEQPPLEQLPLTDPPSIAPPSISMADGTLISEPSEIQILHALDQKINRLERMTVGIFEIIRHLGVQVHGVSHHLTNLETKMERLFQVNVGTTCTSMNHHTTQFGQQTQGEVQEGEETGTFVDQTNAHILPGVVMNHYQHPPIPMAEVSSIPTDCSARRLSWNERFEELKRYKETNGHCDVPQIYDTGLGTWVSAQRSQFKRYVVGKTSSMTHQRKAALEKIGFSWSLRKRFSWEERFAELKHYSDTHNGSCDVPNEGDYKALWTWCQNQKQAYKRGREGKSHPVPVERVTLMEQIGFRWTTSSSAAAATSSEHCSAYYPSLSTPTEGSNSPLSDSDGICSEIGEL